MAAKYRQRDDVESLEEESMRWSAARKNNAPPSMSGKALRHDQSRIVDRMPGAPK
jgi:hypothetical protein